MAPRKPANAKDKSETSAEETPAVETAPEENSEGVVEASGDSPLTDTVTESDGEVGVTEPESEPEPAKAKRVFTVTSPIDLRVVNPVNSAVVQLTRGVPRNLSQAMTTAAQKAAIDKEIDLEVAPYTED